MVRTRPPTSFLVSRNHKPLQSAVDLYSSYLYIIKNSILCLKFLLEEHIIHLHILSNNPSIYRFVTIYFVFLPRFLLTK